MDLNRLLPSFNNREKTIVDVVNNMVILIYQINFFLNVIINVKYKRNVIYEPE